MEYDDNELFYNIGYRNYVQQGIFVELEKNLFLILIGISILFQFILGIDQILTLFSLIVTFAILNTSKELSQKNLFLIFSLIYVSHIVDYLLIDITVPPGQLVIPEFGPIEWILELIWTLIFATYILRIFKPKTARGTKSHTIIPETDYAKQNLQKLGERLTSTNYEISEIEDKVDVSLLEEEFSNQIKYFLGVTLALVFINLSFWQYYNQITGGDNIIEIYLVSGIALLALIIQIFNLLYLVDWDEDEN